MITDLWGRGDIQAEADILVIGAGTVGLPVSVLLARRTGKRVLCLESGGERQDGDTHPLNEVVHRSMVYAGASEGRFRSLGGTSTRWGGALIPFQPADIENARWPVSFDELAPHIAEVEALFGLEAGPYSDPSFPFALGKTHVNRLGKWPAFNRRNVAKLLDEPIRKDPRLEILLNAHVTEIRAGKDGIAVRAASANGDGVLVGARHLIVAAGAIETTRLALLIDRQNGHAVSRNSGALGKFFADHISADVAEISTPRRSDLNEIFGFRFSGNGCMRNIRFELAQDADARASLPPSFAQVAFEVEKPGGYHVLREFLLNLQRRQLPPLPIALDLVAHAPWLAKAAWWRLLRRRLLFPARARLVANVVVEQAASPENSITLSRDKADPFGVPIAEIDWRVSDRDKRNILHSAELFRQTWEASGFSGLGRWSAYGAERIREKLDRFGGFYHPTGSTRMAEDPADGVVDRDLRLFAMPNVQLLSTSVLPTGGGANPTMMVLLLAMRLVDRHARG